MNDERRRELLLIGKVKDLREYLCSLTDEDMARIVVEEYANKGENIGGSKFVDGTYCHRCSNDIVM